MTGLRRPNRRISVIDNASLIYRRYTKVSALETAAGAIMGRESTSTIPTQIISRSCLTSITSTVFPHCWPSTDLAIRPATTAASAFGDEQ